MSIVYEIGKNKFYKISIYFVKTITYLTCLSYKTITQLEILFSWQYFFFFFKDNNYNELVNLYNICIQEWYFCTSIFYSIQLLYIILFCQFNLTHLFNPKIDNCYHKTIVFKMVQLSIVYKIIKEHTVKSIQT